ncbi:MAG: hypothetical protein ABI850_05165 [Flavobacterium sp.]
MKNLVLCLTVLFFTLSCTNDEDYSAPLLVNSALDTSEVSNRAKNTSNPFDQTGAEFYAQFTSYIAENGYPSSNSQIKDQMLLLSAKASKSSLTSKSIITITPEMIALILANPEVKLLEIIDSSSLSNAVKNNLTSFVGDLVYRQNDDYDQVYSFIIDYEEDVIDNTILEEDEKDTILKVSSISRYSLYAEARVRDRDWETSVTNRSSIAVFDKTDRTLTTLAVLFNTLH